MTCVLFFVSPTWARGISESAGEFGTHRVCLLVGAVGKLIAFYGVVLIENAIFVQQRFTRTRKNFNIGSKCDRNTLKHLIRTLGWVQF